MAFGQSPRIARPVDPAREGVPYELARILAEWATRRDQDAPMQPRDERAAVSIEGDYDNAGLFFLNDDDINELRRRLLG